ncbi:unnamed protein product [Nezara viridula]|uniref:Uncharacterized protein n=1 Tax=Nezara viridula TaxID=85310 RepID=A0A9P0HFG3_NEZVI|nr:unnamed protein product [Nezara viridula]
MGQSHRMTCNPFGRTRLSLEERDSRHLGLRSDRRGGDPVQCPMLYFWRGSEKYSNCSNVAAKVDSQENE